MRILLVEDHEPLGKLVREQLVDDGHAVDWARTLADAKAYTLAADHDLTLLDLMLPDGRGMDFLEQQRASSNRRPILILTAQDQIADRIVGLNAGADDYLVKPFDLGELSARVYAVARRAAGDPAPILTFGELTIDRRARRVKRNDEELELTLREWSLLETLSMNAGNIISKTRLEDSCYAAGEEIESNAIEAHISRLRKKIGRDAITTVRGIGYRLNNNVSEE